MAAVKVTSDNILNSLEQLTNRVSDLETSLSMTDESLTKLDKNLSQHFEKYEAILNHKVDSKKVLSLEAKNCRIGKQI